MNDDIVSKQLYNYLKPLLPGIDRNLINKLNFNSFDLSKDSVFCCKRNCASEVFVSILLSLHTADYFKVISLTRLLAINDAYKTKYEDPEYGALGAITDTKILFITSGGFEVPKHTGNVLDVIFSTRRALGLKTYIFHHGSKVDFLNYKSTLVSNVYSLDVRGGSNV